MAVSFLDAQQACSCEPSDVPARGLRCDSSAMGELSRGQFTILHQRRQHGGTRRIAEERT